MGKISGFLEWSRTLPERRPVDQRLGDYKELQLPQSAEQMREQAGRCMDCGVPTCQQGCPLGNQIPDWNELAYRDRWQDAHRRLASTNNFPEFTGRLCPAPCEAACVLSVNAQPVTIEQSEREIIERAFTEGWVKAEPPRQRSGHHVAVVGSGPAGLAAAAQLNSIGHRVTVYEKSDRLGGLLRYGIPDFKLEKWVIDRRLEVMKDEGIQFVTDADVGGILSWGELRQRHDALLIAIGAGRPRDLPVPGRELTGVHFAMDYLTQQNQLNAGDTLNAAHIDAAGKRVIILGGGDTGSDCLGTALRQGASDVQQIELFPQLAKQRDAGNPWPQWPMIARTSSSQEEGGEREFALMTKSLSGDDGVLQQLHAVRIDVATGDKHDKGRPVLKERPGSELELEVDILLLAMGFVGPSTATLVEQLGVQLNGRGNLEVGSDFATSVDGVFAAGDAQRGQSLIVWAISDGREAARNIDSYLREGERPWLPTRGIDQPFGGR